MLRRFHRAGELRHAGRTVRTGTAGTQTGGSALVVVSAADRGRQIGRMFAVIRTHIGHLVRSAVQALAVTGRTNGSVPLQQGAKGLQRARECHHKRHQTQKPLGTGNDHKAIMRASGAARKHAPGQEKDQRPRYRPATMTSASPTRVGTCAHQAWVAATSRIRHAPPAASLPYPRNPYRSRSPPKTKRLQLLAMPAARVHRCARALRRAAWRRANGAATQPLPGPRNATRSRQFLQRAVNASAAGHGPLRGSSGLLPSPILLRLIRVRTQHHGVGGCAAAWAGMRYRAPYRVRRLHR